MRSLLFVPGDSPRKLERGLVSGADALILDLEDSVSHSRKAEARATTLAFLQANAASAKRPRLLVRVNALDTGMTDADLDELFAIDRDAWLAEADSTEEFYAVFGDKLPAALRSELEALRYRLKNA